MDFIYIIIIVFMRYIIVNNKELNVCKIFFEIKYLIILKTLNYFVFNVVYNEFM